MKHIDFPSATFLASNLNEVNTFRVVTYNLWNFNTPYFERLELIINILRELNADIIGLQEVKYSNFDYPTKPHESFQATAFEMPFHYKSTPFHSGHQIWDIVTKLHEYQFYWVAAHHELRNTRISSIPFIQHSGNQKLLYSINELCQNLIGCCNLLAEGLAILSKLPIMDTDVVLLTRNFTGRFSDLHQRIGLSVEVLHSQGTRRNFELGRF
jgi:endonuclease/exonuclease/phosphatase family metal-dependent hydrolase